MISHIDPTYVHELCEDPDMFTQGSAGQMYNVCQM